MSFLKALSMRDFGGYTVHGEVSDIVNLSTLADLDDLAETFDPQCFLSIEMSTIAQVS